MEGWWQTTAVPESSMVGLCGALVKLCKQISPPGQTLFFSILFFPDFFAGTIFSETKKSSKDENCISTFLFLGFFSRTGSLQDPRLPVVASNVSRMLLSLSPPTHT